MESPNLYEWVLGAATGAVGWFARMVWQDVREIRGDIARHRTEVAEKYASKDDLQRIDAKLDRILDKLDQKQDK